MKWEPTPILLPGKFVGRRSLAGYSPWGCRVRHHLATKQHQQQSKRKHPNTFLEVNSFHAEMISQEKTFSIYLWRVTHKIL